MLSKQQRDIVVQTAKKYGIAKLYLFGSALNLPPPQIHDYDFAVEGVPPGNFFEFYGELLQVFPKSVDVVNLSGKKTKFSEIVRAEGQIIYDSKKD